MLALYLSSRYPRPAFLWSLHTLWGNCESNRNHQLLPCSTQHRNPCSYTNTLLVVFNNRIFLTNKAPVACLTQHTQSDQPRAQIVEIKPQPSANQDHFKIHISRDTYVTTDKGSNRRSVSCLSSRSSKKTDCIMLDFSVNHRMEMILLFPYNVLEYWSKLIIPPHPVVHILFITLARDAHIEVHHFVWHRASPTHWIGYFLYITILQHEAHEPYLRITQILYSCHNDSLRRTLIAAIAPSVNKILVSFLAHTRDITIFCQLLKSDFARWCNLIVAMASLVAKTINIVGIYHRFTHGTK